MKPLNHCVLVCFAYINWWCARQACMYSVPMRANKLETALFRDHLACQAPPDMVFTRVLHACSHRKIGTRHVFDNNNVSYFIAHEESEFEKVCCKYLKQKCSGEQSQHS